MITNEQAATAQPTTTPPVPGNDVQEDTLGISSDMDVISDPTQNMPGIPDDIVSQWKTEYGVVFRIWFLRTQYVYRNFTYSEYKELRRSIRDEYAQDLEGGDDVFKEEIQKMCVLWPQDYKQRLDTGKPQPIPGGIPLLLGDYILAASGFSDAIIPDVIGEQQ